MYRNLKKLVGRSPAELHFRARQTINSLLERIDCLPWARLPSDEQFLSKFAPVVASTVDNLLAHFQSRGANTTFRYLMDLSTSVAEFMDRFPDDAAAVITRSDRICQGSFDILGYQAIHYGGELPNWHYDPISNLSIPKVHWTVSEKI
jgi:hypothetical protein